MTGDPINLTALRAHAGVTDEAVPMTPRTVLALIDAVEAAREIDTREVINGRAGSRLAEALERFTP